jgi:hypothetical protein
MLRLNISIIGADSALTRTLDGIKVKYLVAGVFQTVSTSGNGDSEIDGVLKIVNRTGVSERPCTLDLIAHARGGELHLCQWLISETEGESTSLKRKVRRGTIGAVRLLGCLTAATVKGRAAMCHLKKVLGVQVFGTTSLIGARDFDESGFKRDNYLIECDRLQTGNAISAEIAGTWFADLDLAPNVGLLDEQLRAETYDEALADVLKLPAPSRWDVKPAAPQLGALATLLADRDSGLRIAPGLLLLPDAEALFPAPSENGISRFFRVTFLLGGQLLRVYPVGRRDGVLLRPSKPILL